jgi:hypothetical protein
MKKLFGKRKSRDDRRPKKGVKNMDGFGQKCWAWIAALMIFLTGLGLFPSAVQAQGLSKGQLV